MKVIFIMSLLLLPSSFVFADEGHSDTNNLSDDMEMFMNGEESEGSSHEGHTMTPEEHSNMTNETDSSTHNESSTEEDHSSSETGRLYA